MGLNWNGLKRQFVTNRNGNSKNLTQLFFSKHTSFSTDVDVAIEFTQSDDVHVADNSVMVVLNDIKHVVYCDVTWISMYGEGEVC